MYDKRKNLKMCKSSSEVSKCGSMNADSEDSGPLVTLPLSAMISKNNYKPALMYAFLLTKEQKRYQTTILLSLQNRENFAIAKAM